MELPIYQFQQCKVTHYDMWEIDCKRLERDSHLRFSCLYGNLLTDHVIAIQKIKRQDCFTALHSSAVFLQLLMFLPVERQILLHVTKDIFPCNTAWKGSSGMSYSASSCLCCGVLTCCIHGSQQAGYCKPSTSMLSRTIGLWNGEWDGRNSMSILLWVANHCLMVFE